MRALKADQIIAAVACRPQYQAVAGPPQCVYCLDQERGWQRWAVAIDEDDAVVSGGEQDAYGAEQNIAKVVVDLQQQPERRREQTLQLGSTSAGA